jgi:hypothetical protein
MLNENLETFNQYLAAAIKDGFDIVYLPYDKEFSNALVAAISGEAFNAPAAGWSNLYLALEALMVSGLG